MKKVSFLLTKEFLLKEYILNKKSFKKIAQELNISSSSIKRYLIYHDIKIRSVSESLKGHTPWNKNKKIGIIPKSAFKKGNIPWNKDLTKETDKRVFKNAQKISKALKGQTSSQKGRIYVPREIRYCACDCGQNFECRITDTKRYIKNHQPRRMNLRPPQYAIDNLTKYVKENMKNHPLSEEHKKKIGDSNRGKKRSEAARLKMSKSAKNKKVSVETRNKLSLSSKLMWAKEEIRNKITKAVLKGLKIKPNKPEKLLNKLLQQILPKEYKFVGDGKVIINGFNPDFVNVNGQKKIIELYGDYWHNRKEVIERDGRRLIAYKKYGYKTLIIWEHELKDLDKIKKRIMEFNNVKSNFNKTQ